MKLPTFFMLLKENGYTVRCNRLYKFEPVVFLKNGHFTVMLGICPPKQGGMHMGKTIAVRMYVRT